ncbi:hypothetical protein [Bradyrhizobium sp. dw_78]|uniref:hypothetical protein n=1 Tax=Bradyrhizobium sp. dw_78 TaxID=2719793 RepID=UPI001BD3B0F4|nr:hypothetical protein [Bradyrhizobium sp. dw_78]
MTAMSMNAMTYRKKIKGAASGQELSSEPLTPDTIAKCKRSAAARFQRPGPDILNETIPVFFIGRNQNGFWVARDAEGKFGGLFWSRVAALRFASSVRPGGCATVFPQARFELDIGNAGNPLISWLETARRLLVREV